ncbi:DUF5518 domain-containing protein [Haloarcula litorea]|uniref:DUF5518 domain-containing protein n=1 Tax=Haloarcula litorea TaxID=3032579 RepID=UPI0023E82FDD|nr:DUF5518 domain-containing protein [Halomicroarcula sp. GDY20]
MSPTWPPSVLRDDTWRYGIVAGLAVVPFTAASYWQTGSEMSLGVVFWAGVVAGYLVKRRGLDGTAVGFRAGLVGALPGLWMAADLTAFVLGLGGGWFRLLQLLVVAVVVSLLFLFASVTGALGGRLGGWLAERGGHPRETGSGA